MSNTTQRNRETGNSANPNCNNPNYNWSYNDHNYYNTASPNLTPITDHNYSQKPHPQSSSEEMSRSDRSLVGFRNHHTKCKACEDINKVASSTSSEFYELPSLTNSSDRSRGGPTPHLPSSNLNIPVRIAQNLTQSNINNTTVKTTLVERTSRFFNSVRQANKNQPFPPPPTLPTGRARGTKSKPLSIHQINLRKSQVPTANMVQKFSKSENFLIMAQEPWCAGRGLAGLAPSMVRHSHTTPARAAIIHSRNLDIWDAPQFSDKDTCTCIWNTKSKNPTLKEIIIISCYWAGNNPSIPPN